RRLLTRPTALAQQRAVRIDLAIPELRRNRVAPRADLIVGNARPFRPLLDPSDAAVVGRVDEHITKLGIGRASAPIVPADRAGKNHARLRRSARRAIDPWSEGSFVI